MAETGDYISYEEFGKRFFELAVSEERILGAVNTLAGEPIDVGPMGVGPGRIAKVRATGSIGEAKATRIEGDLISYRVVLPVHLEFEVNLQVDVHRFRAELEVPLLLAARAAEPLKVVIDAQAPKAKEVSVTLRADGLRASILSKTVGIEGELQRFVAKYVGRELNKPSVVAARTIDLARPIESAWASMSPESAEERSVTEDLEGALQQEIDEHPQLADETED